MSALEIVTLVLSVVSIVGAFFMWIVSWRASVEREKKKLLADRFDFAAILKSAQSSMSEKLSEQQREVITRIVWRSSGVPLAAILRIPKERYYIFQALADPSRYPWEKEASDTPG